MSCELSLEVVLSCNIHLQMLLVIFETPQQQLLFYSFCIFKLQVKLIFQSWYMDIYLTLSTQMIKCIFWNKFGFMAHLNILHFELLYGRYIDYSYYSWIKNKCWFDISWKKQQYWWYIWWLFKQILTILVHFVLDIVLFYIFSNSYVSPLKN